MAVPPGPVAVPLTVSVAVPGAIGSNRIAPRSPVPVAPVASADRAMVMSTRPGLTCWAKAAFAAPDRMKLPSFTARARSSAGSNVTVSVTVDTRDAFTMEIGTV